MNIINTCLKKLQYGYSNDNTYIQLSQPLLNKAAIDLITNILGDNINPDTLNLSGKSEYYLEDCLTLAGYASQKGDLVLMQWLKANGADINRGSHCYSTLHIAVEYQQINMIHFLVSQGIDINQIAFCDFWDTYTGCILKTDTPLHRAVKFGYLNMFKLLLNLNARVLPKNFTSDYNIQPEAYVLQYTKRLIETLSCNPYSQEYQHFFGHGHHRNFNTVPKISVLERILSILKDAEKKESILLLYNSFENTSFTEQKQMCLIEEEEIISSNHSKKTESKNKLIAKKI
jgi:hypothetical protein